MTNRLKKSLYPIKISKLKCAAHEYEYSIFLYDEFMNLIEMDIYCCLLYIHDAEHRCAPPFSIIDWFIDTMKYSLLHF